MFPSNQLGREIEQMEGVRAGTQEMMVATPAWFASFYPKIEVFELPFLFADWDEIAKVYDSEVFEQISKDAEATTGIKIVGWFPLGFRNVYSNKRHVEKLEDLSGLKLRLQNAKVHIRTFEALGAVPISLPAADVYQAIKTGVIDGAETPTTIIALQKYAEIAPYISKTQHFFATFLIYVNAKMYDGLSIEHKRAFDSAVRAAAAAGYELARKADQDAEAVIKAAGGKIAEPSAATKAALRAAVKKVYDEFGPALEPYYSKVMALQSK